MPFWRSAIPISRRRPGCPESEVPLNLCHVVSVIAGSVIPRPAPATSGRRQRPSRPQPSGLQRCSGSLVALAWLLAAGVARAGPLFLEPAAPLVPPQSLPASGALGPTLRLPESGAADLPIVPGPLQWPGEAAAQPSAGGGDPEATKLKPDASAPSGSQTGIRSGTPVQPQATSTDPERRLVLDRHRRLLMVLENGKERHRYSVAVGMPGWETPVGQFKVIEKTANPVWEHPATGVKIKPGPDNPLGSRWIGFHRDCRGRKGFNGLEHLELKGCVIAGFHGTPNRASIGRAVSHGCVRLYDENVQELFELVRIGTEVTVLP